MTCCMKRVPKFLPFEMCLLNLVSSSFRSFIDGMLPCFVWEVLLAFACISVSWVFSSFSASIFVCSSCNCSNSNFSSCETFILSISYSISSPLSARSLPGCLCYCSIFCKCSFSSFSSCSILSCSSCSVSEILFCYFN